MEANGRTLPGVYITGTECLEFKLIFSSPHNLKRHLQLLALISNDIMFLLGYGTNMIGRRIKKSLKGALKLFDNFLNDDDKFGFLVFNKIV